MLLGAQSTPCSSVGQCNRCQGTIGSRNIGCLYDSLALTSHQLQHTSILQHRIISTQQQLFQQIESHQKSPMATASLMKIRAQHPGHIACGKAFLRCTRSTLTLLTHLCPRLRCHTLHMATILPMAWHHWPLQSLHPMALPLQPLHHMLRAHLRSLRLALPCLTKFR